jgi:glycine amidinotransferase
MYQRTLRANAFTQWGKLKRIMVGKAENDCFQPKQPCQNPKINTPDLAESIPWPKGAKHPKSIERANIQLSNLTKVLRAEGIDVVRPDSMDWKQPIKAPWWEVENQYGIVCPRDSIMTVGNIIMEASMSRRDRFFEVFALRRLVEKVWNEDPNCLWKAAPKSSMRDSMYDPSWHTISEEERTERMGKADFGLKKNEEIVFDAADFTRTGKHIFGQISMTCNEQALKWLHRELSPYGFVVHPLRISYDTTPSHIDCTFVVLKPGLVMTNPARPLCEEDKKLWLDNGWKLVDCPWPTNLDRPAFSQSSYWLSMNVLVISPDKVIVEANETKMQEFLSDHGFEVIPVPFRDVYEFGGGLHCATWDIEREDSMVDLFPNFDINKSEWHQQLRLPCS